MAKIITIASAAKLGKIRCDVAKHNKLRAANCSYRLHEYSSNMYPALFMSLITSYAFDRISQIELETVKHLRWTFTLISPAQLVQKKTRG